MLHNIRVENFVATVSVQLSTIADNYTQFTCNIFTKVFGDIFRESFTYCKYQFKIILIGLGKIGNTNINI